RIGLMLFHKPVRNFVLVQGSCHQAANSSLKILNLDPALSLRNGRIAYRGLGGVPAIRAAVLQFALEIKKVVGGTAVSAIFRQAIPGHGPGIVLRHSLSVLIHPAELIFRVAVALSRGFHEPGDSPGVILFYTAAVLKHVTDVFGSGDAAML